MRVNIKVSQAVHAKLSNLAENKNKSLNEVIEFLLRKDTSIQKLEQQLEDYKQQIAKNSSLQAPTNDGKVQSSISGDAGEPSITDATEITCFSRYQHNGILLCANLPPPKSLEIKSLKRCLHCRKRLSTKIAERQGLIVKTKNFVTCGAEEHTDEKKGVMLYCHRGSKYGGQWVTPKDCQKAKCIDFKEVKTPL